MEKDIKLIALDLDGTLVKNKKDLITKETLEAIKHAQERGIEVVIATGRNRSLSLDIANKINSHYLVTLNGGEIWTRSGKLLKSQPLDRSTVEKVIKIHQQYPSYFWLFSHEKYYRNELPNDYLAQEWLKIGFDVKDDRLREKKKQQLTQLDRIELSNSNLTNMELNPKGVHKASGIQFLLERLELNFEQVLAIGDSMNDLTMLKEAGIGIAMGNAQDIIKEKADWVTQSSGDHGVSVAIKRFIP
ncbi:HAD family hydrolase [Amphibacillus sp. Q70]|uniref:HAD family hydrolase n=1 Tax=Amphibacillus sp. Q70 TaxID=3453416 RepID=UPI003F83F00B